MKFHVLGPLEVIEGESSLPLGGPKQRAVLAALVLHANTGVAKPRLIDWIWGETAPAAVEHAVESYVSRLRGILGPGRITATAGGYRLSIEPDELDADVATALAERAKVATAAGDLDTAIALIREAVTLFRGPVLGDLKELLFTAPDVARLEYLRLSLLERGAELTLESGAHADAAGQLEALVGLHAGHERLWEMLMLAHYRAGRQAAALQAFVRARRHLVDEVGIEPGPGLVDLQARILRQDPELLVLPKTAWPVTAEGPGAQEPRSPTRHRRAGAVGALALVAVVVVVAVALSVVASDKGASTVDPGPAYGVALVERTTGKIRTTLPYETALAMHYSDGLFWFVRGTAEGLAVSIEAVDEESYEVEHEIAVPFQDIGDLLVNDGIAWVTDYTTPEIARIDIATGLVTDRVDLSGGPPPAFRGTSTGAEQIAAAGGSIWVGRTGEVVQVDPTASRVVRRFPMPYEWGMVSAGGRVWICRQDGVSWIDAATGEEGPVAPIDRPQNLVAVGNEVWAADPHGNVYAVGADGTVRIQSQDPGLGSAVDLDGDGSTVWSAHGDNGTLVATDATTLESREYQLGGRLGGIAVGRQLVATGVYPVVPSQPLESPVMRLAWSRSTADPIDPAAADLRTNPWMAQMERLTCATLQSPAGTPSGPGLVPDLAIGEPRIRRDGLVHRYTIRGDRGFAPPAEGTVSAEDVLYSIERALSPKLGARAPAARVVHEIRGLAEYRAGRAGHIAGLRAEGPHLTIRLNRPSPALPWKLSLSYFCVVPQGTPVVPNGLLFAPPSAAPYYVTAHENGGLTVLARNPNYGGASAPIPKTMVFDEDLSAAAAVADTVVGEIHHVAMDDPTLAPPATPTRGPTSYIASPLMRVHFLAFNSRSGPFKERSKRLAFVGLLDPRPLAAAQHAIASTSLLPAGIFGSRNPESRPARTGALRIGHPLGLGVQRGCRECLATASALATQMRRAGIGMRIQEVANISRISLPVADLDLTLTSTTLEYPDPAAFLAMMIDSGIPAGWLPPGVAQRVRALAALEGTNRTSAAVQLAEAFRLGAIPVAPYATGVMGELVSQDLDCPQALLPGLGLDLVRCSVPDAEHPGAS
jgi:DNA-binding SARP family transcriptional activator/ABC-type transport system substrate-binding protein